MDRALVALGGTLLAFAALGKLNAGLAQLAGAAIAWRSIAPILEAAGRPAAVAPPGLALAAPTPSAPIASLRGVVYRPARRGTPVLDGCELAVPADGRLLLEGASGAGKSTMAALLAGLRRPDSGLVLAGGLDLASLGDQGWRRRIACAPQFHDNHLFSAPLAFNLLLGRAWPPRPEDLADAQAVCDELGLGDVIGRMPGGLFEMVGETGWQLSHGERCRVYLARTLLQGAPLIVLDESLAALDPETMQVAIACIERRARAAIVIAHP
jgi:ATP-binding cassette subfamily B protein